MYVGMSKPLGALEEARRKQHICLYTNPLHIAPLLKYGAIYEGERGVIQTLSLVH